MGVVFRTSSFTRIQRFGVVSHFRVAGARRVPPDAKNFLCGSHLFPPIVSVLSLLAASFV
jgi:hypothetical protein